MDNLIQENNISSIFKQSLMNGFKILLFISFVLASFYSVFYFKNSVDSFFVVAFQNIVQFHPYLFMVLGYLLCSVFAFVSSFLLKTKDRNIINQKTSNILALFRLKVDGLSQMPSKPCRGWLF